MATPEEVQLQNQLNDELRVTNNTLTSIANNLAEQFKLQQKIGKEVEQTANDYYKDLAKTLKSSAKDVFTIAENQEAISRGALRSSTIQSQITKSLRDQNKALATFELLEQEIGSLTEEEAKWRQDALAASEAQLATLNAQLIKAKQIEKTAGLTGKIFEGIAKIPLLGHLVDTEKILENVYETAAKTGSKWKSFGSGLSTTFGQIGKKMMDPVILFTAQIAIFKKIFNIAKDLNEQFISMRRQLALNEEQTDALYQKAADYAAASKNSFVTTTMLFQSQLKLNQALGTQVDLGNENAEAFGRLTHFYGLSEEAASKLVELGIEQKQNGVDILNTVNKTVVQTKAAVGGSISYQKVLEKVSNTSAGLLTNFKGNVGELTKAIVQADRLGLTLEQVNQIGESLLNFESSIESELKAELLLGKSLNLEKARSAALSGDTAKLTQEISKQVGTIHDFEKLNVIQRKAYAEVFGMNVDQMATMLRKREFENQLGEVAKKSAKEQLEYAEKHGIKIEDSLKQQLEAKSLADEQHELFQSLNDLIARITKGPMSTFIHMLEKALGFAGSIIDSLNQLSGGGLGNALSAAIIGAPLLIAGVRTLSGGIKSMFLGSRGSSPMNPMYVSEGGVGGGGGGVMDMITGGGGKGGGMFSKRNLVGRFGAKGARNLLRGGFAAGGIGLGVDLLSSGIASNYEQGSTGYNVAEGIGTTAGYAGTGAMIGSIIPGVGTVIGGIIGGSLGAIKSYFDAENEKREREKREKEENKASAERMDKLIASVSDISQRPLVFNAGTDTIARLQTAQRQYGAPAIAG
jgi:hypothetical protein